MACVRSSNQMKRYTVVYSVLVFVQYEQRIILYCLDTLRLILRITLQYNRYRYSLRSQLCGGDEERCVCFLRLPLPAMSDVLPCRWSDGFLADMTREIRVEVKYNAVD